MNRKLLQIMIMFFLCGLIYLGVEVMWRGYTHRSMFIVAGLIFVIGGEQNNTLPWEMPFWLQCLIVWITILSVEFFAGCMINLWLGLGVWNYSNMPGNILGQICPQYALLWLPCSPIIIILYDSINYGLFDGEKPHYKLV